MSEYKQVWRFYVDRTTEMSSGTVIGLDSDEAHFAFAVLRLAVGEDIELADGYGRIARATLVRVDKKTVEARIEHSRREPINIRRVFAIVGLTKPGALDEVVQSCVESGVLHIILFKGKRSTSKQEVRPDKLTKQIRELCRVTKAAWLPQVSVVDSLQHALERARVDSGHSDVQIFACDERPSHRLVTGIKNNLESQLRLNSPSNSETTTTETPHLLSIALKSIAKDFYFVVGPEASFSTDEYDVLLNEEKFGHLNFVTLGPRILRTPAAVSAAANMLSGVIESTDTRSHFV
jgi:RsmE family RNA methyltransferase